MCVLCVSVILVKSWVNFGNSVSECVWLSTLDVTYFDTILSRAEKTGIFFSSGTLLQLWSVWNWRASVVILISDFFSPNFIRNPPEFLCCELQLSRSVQRRKQRHTSWSLHSHASWLVNRIFINLYSDLFGLQMQSNTVVAPEQMVKTCRISKHVIYKCC